MPRVEADSPEGRIVAAIVAGPRYLRDDGTPDRSRPPWTCSVALLLEEAEISGAASAEGAMARLGREGYIELWHLPDGSAAQAPLVTFTPFGAEMAGEAGLARVLVEDEDEDPSSLRWAWPGQVPRHYELPAAWKTLSLDDPRLARGRAGLTYTDDERVELLADRETGKPVLLFGKTVPVARSWNQAERAARAATTERRVG